MFQKVGDGAVGVGRKQQNKDAQDRRPWGRRARSPRPPRRWTQEGPRTKGWPESPGLRKGERPQLKPQVRKDEFERS